MSHQTLLPTDDAQALKLADAVQISPAGIVSRTLLQTPELRVVLFAFADGQELTSHTSRRRRRPPRTLVWQAARRRHFGSVGLSPVLLTPGI